MATPRRQCEVKLPHGLVERLKQEPGGIQPILSRIEKDYGLSTSSSYFGAKNYFIIGPNPEILEMALGTLRSKYDEQKKNASDVTGQLKERCAIWRLHGDYGTKATNLFQGDIEEMRRLPSVKVHISPHSLEILCGYDYVEQVKQIVKKLKADIESLCEDHIRVGTASVHLPALKRFVGRIHKYDRTVVCIWSRDQHSVTVYGKTDTSVQEVLNEWAVIQMALYKI